MGTPTRRKEKIMGNDKSKRNIALAVDVYQWLKEHEMFDSCIIYFNGIAIYSESTWGDEQGTLMPDGIGYVYHNKRATDYFEYGNDDTVSMSFDGSDLYEVLNLDWEYANLSEDFRSVFNRHGMFFELGYSWSLSAYEI